ncbi:MAG: hypothetical protein AB8C02_06285 [Halioglobus sp.]
MQFNIFHLSAIFTLLASLTMPAQAHLEFFFTSFEDEGAGTFSVGEAPLTATFTGGQAQAVSGSKTGSHSWQLNNAGTSVVTLDSPADQVDFWVRDTANTQASTFRVYDTSNILLREGAGTQDFNNIIVTRGGGQSRIARVEFESATGGNTVVDDFSFAANEDPIITNITITLEEPIASEIHGGVGNLRGWAISPDGIDRVEIFIDGAFAFEAPYGGNRPDVAAAFPSITNSISSGFSLAYGYSNLLPGEHTITARAYSILGAQKDSSSTFTVVGFDKTFIAPGAIVNANNATVTAAGDEISVENISIDGRIYDLKMQWRTAEQGFEIIEIR